MVEQAALDILLPVLESSMILAAHYTKLTGRSVVTATDLQYGLKCMAMNHVGDRIGSLFPEIYENESDSDEDSIEEVPEDETPEFTRYQGNDEWCTKMNAAVDAWDSWVPSGPAETMLKRAIENKM